MTTIDTIMALADEYRNAVMFPKQKREELRTAIERALTHDAARKEGCMTEDRDDRIERGRTAEEKAAALEPWANEPDVDAATMLRLIKTIKYLVGIAERGEGRKIADDETPEQFVLGYVKRLEQTNPDASAKLREKNGGRA